MNKKSNNNHGGARPGSGPKKGNTQISRDTLIEGLRKHYGTKNEETTLHALIADAMMVDSCVKYIIERIFGRPVMTIEAEVTHRDESTLSDVELMEAIRKLSMTVHQN